MKNRFNAALLSIVMPGLGQLYNRHFLKAIVFLVFEHIVNKLAHINGALMLCMNGKHTEALEMVNFEYALFYPGFYVLCIYDAVLCAGENPNRNAAIWFISAGLFGCLAIIYSHMVPIPIFTTGLFIIVLTLIGTFVCSKPENSVT